VKDQLVKKTKKSKSIIPKKIEIGIHKELKKKTKKNENTKIKIKRA
jgi:hypothetical protein